MGYQEWKQDNQIGYFNHSAMKVGSLDQGGSSESVRKSLNFGYILKLESIGFAT